MNTKIHIRIDNGCCPFLFDCRLCYRRDPRPFAPSQTNQKNMWLFVVFLNSCCFWIILLTSVCVVYFWQRMCAAKSKPWCKFFFYQTFLLEIQNILYTFFLPPRGFDPRSFGAVLYVRPWHPTTLVQNLCFPSFHTFLQDVDAKMMTTKQSMLVYNFFCGKSSGKVTPTWHHFEWSLKQ